MHTVFLPTRPGKPTGTIKVTVEPVFWPVWARAIARGRVEGEIGLGDTLERVLRRLAADKAAKAWARLAGKPCGCQDRKAWLNGRFPYRW